LKRTALLIIDVQQGMFMEEDPVYNAGSLLANINLLLHMARARQMPVFYIQHTEARGELLEKGSSPWQIHPDIAPLQTDIMIEKKTPDSFLGTDLHDELTKRHIGHLVLAGIQSDLCVDTTCRMAYSLGYSITLAADAHSTWGSKELTAQQIINHHNTALRWFGQVQKTEDITERLSVDV